MANNREREYSEISESIKAMRRIQSAGAVNVLNESEDNGNSETDAVPYTSQDGILKNSLQPCRVQFGADFGKLKTPMLYYPEDGDITLSGVIPSMNNAKFQFRLLDNSGSGCYLWLDSIQLSDDVISRINKIYGVYKNWRQMLSTSEDIKPIQLKNKE